MEPYKIVMLIIVIALEIPALIILAVGWVKACREAKEMEKAEADRIETAQDTQMRTEV